MHTLSQLKFTEIYIYLNYTVSSTRNLHRNRQNNNRLAKTGAGYFMWDEVTALSNIQTMPQNIIKPAQRHTF